MIKSCTILHNLILQSLRDLYESILSELQHFEEVNEFLLWVKCSSGSLATPKGRFYKAPSMPLCGLGSREEGSKERLITSTVHEFSLKYDIIDYTWAHRT